MSVLQRVRVVLFLVRSLFPVPGAPASHGRGADLASWPVLSPMGPARSFSSPMQPLIEAD